MGIYLVLFLILLFFTLVEINAKNRIGIVYKILIVVLLVSVSGFRYGIGNDYGSYYGIFNHSDELSRIEPGFRALVDLLDKLGLTAQALFMVTSILVVVPIALTVNKYRPNYFFSALTVYVLSYVYFEGMNTVRQAVAMTIMFVAFCKYIENNKNRNFALLTAVAVLFHSSAVVIGIIGWSVLKFSGPRINIKAFSIALIVSFVLGYSIRSFAGEVGALASFFGYGGYLDEMEQRGVSSGIFHYVLNIYAFVFLFFTKNASKPFSKFDTNVLKLFILGVIIYNFFFEFFIGLRLYWYFYLFVTFVIPSILPFFNQSSRGIAFLMLVGVLAAYTIVSIDSPYYSPYNYSFEFIKQR